MEQTLIYFLMFLVGFIGRGFIKLEFKNPFAQGVK